MGLAESLAKAETVKNIKPRCTVVVLMERLDPEDVAILKQWMADPTKPGTVIEHALKTEGHTVGASTIQRHRRGSCTCTER